MWRHGDVLLAQIDQLPTTAKKTMSSVLAHGEVTGHSHRLETPANAEIWTFGQDFYLKVIAPVRIIHEEHQPITLNPGNYRVWRQREYTPKAIKYVRD